MVPAEDAAADMLGHRPIVAKRSQDVAQPADRHYLGHDAEPLYGLHGGDRHRHGDADNRQRAGWSRNLQLGLLDLYAGVDDDRSDLREALGYLRATRYLRHIDHLLPGRLPAMRHGPDNGPADRLPSDPGAWRRWDAAADLHRDRRHLLAGTACAHPGRLLERL